MTRVGDGRLTQNQIIQSPFIELFIRAKPLGLDALFQRIAPAEIKAYFAFINDSVARKVAQNKDNKKDSAPKDMFDFLCTAKDPDTGEFYSEDALRGEAGLLIPAGSDTTSNTLAAFWFYITRNPAAYDRLIAEIRNTFTSSEDIVTGPRLSSCTYLHACIDETMRLDPGGPSEPPREVLSGGTTIDGEFYPEGVMVGCANWSMGRNEDVFGDPMRFRPERYIVNEAAGVTAEDINRIRASWNVFLIGPTNCVGKNIAMTELPLIIARTLFRVDMKAALGETLGNENARFEWGRNKDHYQVKDAYITVHEGPMILVKSREGF